MERKIKHVIISGSITKHVRLYSMPIDSKDIEKAVSTRKNVIDIITFSLN